MCTQSIVQRSSSPPLTPKEPIMSTEDYRYPSDLESDDASDQYDWSDDDADADSLADNVSFMSLQSIPRSPPPRYSSTTPLPPYTTGPTCVVSSMWANKG